MRLRVLLDDGSELEVAAEVVERTGLGAGDPLDDAGRATLVDADLRWQAREAAFRLLSHRPRTRQELRLRLLRKGFKGDVLDDCLNTLTALGYLDDDAFARSFVMERLRLRPRGRRRLEQELRQKGVEGGKVERAIEEVFRVEEVREEELAREAACAWLRRQPASARASIARDDRSPECERARRRLHGFLARRGFTGSLASLAFSAAVEASRAGDA